MGEFEDKISSLLSSPDGMNQVMSIVRSLAGDVSSEQQAAAPLGGLQAEQASLEDAIPPGPAPDASPVSGAASPPLSAILGQLSGGGFQGLQNIDPRFLSMIMKILGEFSSNDDKNVLLLQSLKPYLKNERHMKIDKAMQIVRLTKTIRTVFETLNGGDGFV